MRPLKLAKPTCDGSDKNKTLKLPTPYTRLICVSLAKIRNQISEAISPFQQWPGNGAFRGLTPK